MKTDCQLLFKLKKTTEGTVAVSGNITQLGSWDPSKAFVLKFQDKEYTQNKLPLILSKGTKIEFKFLITNQDGTILWEDLQKNRKYKLKHPRVLLKAEWNDYDGKEIIEKRQSSSIQLDQEMLKDFKKAKISQEFNPFDHTSSDSSSQSQDSFQYDSFIDFPTKKIRIKEEISEYEKIFSQLKRQTIEKQIDNSYKKLDIVVCQLYLSTKIIITNSGIELQNEQDWMIQNQIVQFGVPQIEQQLDENTKAQLTQKLWDQCRQIPIYLDHNKLKKFNNFCSTFYTPVMENKITFKMLNNLRFTEQYKEAYFYVQNAFFDALNSQKDKIVFLFDHRLLSAVSKLPLRTALFYQAQFPDSSNLRLLPFNIINQIVNFDYINFMKSSFSENLIRQIQYKNQMVPKQNQVDIYYNGKQTILQILPEQLHSKNIVQDNQQALYNYYDQVKEMLQQVKFKFVSFQQDIKVYHNHQHLNHEQFKRIYQGKQRVGLIIDYGICTSKILENLKKSRIHYYIISKGVFNEIDHLSESNLFAENGYLYKINGDWNKLFKFDNESLHAARRIMQNYESQWSQIEYTDTSISWKTLPEEIQQFEQIVLELKELEEKIENIEVVVQNMKVEVRPYNLTKGMIVEMIKKKEELDLVIGISDDEQMFEFKEQMSISFGLIDSVAKWYLVDEKELVDFLQWI